MKSAEQLGTPQNGASSIRIHIDELVLHGFDNGESHRIAAAVQQELSRLMREQGVPQSVRTPMALVRLDAGAIRIRAASMATTTGSEIGRAIYRSFSQQGVGVKRAGKFVPRLRPR